MTTTIREKFIDSPKSEYVTSVNLDKKTYTIAHYNGSIEVPAELQFHRISTESVNALYKALEEISTDLREPVKLIIQDMNKK